MPCGIAYRIASCCRLVPATGIRLRSLLPPPHLRPLPWRLLPHLRAVAATTTSAATETLTLTGSTTVLPIAQAVADAYMQAHPEANIQVSGGGSGVGIQAIINQKVDIGMSSADVSAAQKAQDSNMNIITIAHDGIAIIVNPANTIQDISLAQVKSIYNGSVTSWSSIPGAGMANSNNQIVVVGRDSPREPVPTLTRLS